MRILVISHKYPPSIGGMQKQCFELVRGIETRHQVTELIYKGEGSNLLFLATAWWKALRILKNRNHIDLIYANDGLMAFFLTPLFWWSTVEKVVTIHGLDIVFPMRLYQKWARKYLNKCAAVIAVSDATAQELQRRGIDHKKIHVIKNGFEPADQKVKKIDVLPEGLDPEGGKMLISVGRSVKRKGFSWFIRNVLPALDNNTQYVIVGPSLGNYSGVQRMEKWLPQPVFRLLVLLNGIPVDEIEVHRLIREMRLQDRVFHLSGLDHGQKMYLLQKASLFIMPNLKVEGDFEGFGLVALEAVMAGTLCLASEVDGIPSAIQDKKNGYLLPPADDKEWGSMIKDKLSDEKGRKKNALSFREYTRKHCLTWEKMADQYILIFENIVGEKKSS